MPDSTKTCSRCEQTKSLSDFGKNAATKDGLAYYCRACVKAKLANLTPEQREARRRTNAAYMARQRALPDGGTSFTAEKQREYLALNPQRRREYRRRFKESHPDRIAEWRDRDREISRERSRRWAKNNPEKNAEIGARRRARVRGAKVGKVDLDALWTGTCSICAQPLDRANRWPDPQSPSLDHIIPLSRGGSHSQANLQWTHLVCNLRKYCKLP